MGYVVFWGLRLKHHFIRTCNVLQDFQPEKQNGGIHPARSDVTDNSWVLLVKKESALYFQHKIMATYMSKNYTILEWENEDLNYVLLLILYHLEFILEVYAWIIVTILKVMLKRGILARINWENQA